MRSPLEKQFAKLFQFLETQEQEVQLYSESDSEENRQQITRFVKGELSTEDERELFFTLIRDNPQLLQELANQIRSQSEK